MSSRILITGASGFIGANLVRRYASQGHEVIALTGPSGGAGSPPERLRGVERLGGVRIEACDVTDRPRFRARVRELAPELVVNCAVYGHFPAQKDLDLTYAVNFTAVRDLVEALSGVKGFRGMIQAGSASEYGFNCSTPPETGHLQPDTEYSVSKIAATSYLQYQGRARGFPVWVLRIYLAYGRYQDSGRLLSRLLEEGVRGRLPELTDPEITRDFIHVDDIGAAMDAVWQRVGTVAPGEVFNLGTGVKTRLGDLVDLVRGELGLKVEPVWGTMEKRAGDRSDWYADISKARRDLGWEPKIDLVTGVRATLAWMRERDAVQ